MQMRRAVVNDEPRDAERLADLLEDALDLERQLSTLVSDLKRDHLQRPQKPLKRLAIRSNGNILFLKAEEIDWIEAAGNYVRLNAAGETHLLRETMSGVEAKLPSDLFVRIHRSTIVNVAAVRELQPKPHGDFVAVLASGKRLAMSRSYRERLEEALRLTF